MAGGFTSTLTSTEATNITLPITGTLATLAGTETLTNKTLTNPIISTIQSSSGVSLTLPTVTGTLANLVSPSFTTPTLGAATATTINGLTITGSEGTLTIPSNATLAMVGGFASTLTSTAATSVTLPTAGTLATLAGTETFTNKTLTSPTLTTPTLGVASATSINGLSITGSEGTLTIPTNATLAMAGGFASTLTSTAATDITLPTTGTLATLAGTETFTNKTLTSPTLTTPTLGVASATSIYTSGDVSFNGKMMVEGDASLNGNLTLGNAITVNYLSGYVGIETTAPTNFLQIAGNTLSLAETAPDIGSNHNLLLTSTKTGTTTYAMSLGVDYTTGAGYINAAGNSTNQPICLSTRGGAVAIGKTTAAYTLDMSGSAYMSGSMNFSNNGSGLIWGGGTSQIMDDGDLRIKTDDTMHFFTASTQRMVISSQGYVGIGTSTVSYPLTVSLSPSISTGTATKYFNRANSTASLSYTSASISLASSIYAAGGVVSGNGFYAASDKRIKYNIHDFADIPSINILRYLKPRIFNFIDNLQYGAEPTWGFIAQEVAEIIPNAVTYGPAYIPNIFEVGEIVGKEIKLESKTTTELLKDETDYYPLKIKNTNGEDKIVKITKIIDEKTFKIDEEIETDHNRIFVYGQEVPDFHSLDKDAIFTIATSALQELDKELQETNKRVKVLEDENQNLKQQINEIVDRLTKANL